MDEEQVLIGFGGNLGNAEQICRRAVARLQAEPSIDVKKVSSLYRTKPVGPVAQDWFINGVLLCETVMDPAGLLRFLLQVEQELGRVREVRWGPRTLDLDLLAFGQRRIFTPELTVPHPRLHERLFVLVPLVEIWPEWRHPGLDRSASELLSSLNDSDRDQQTERIVSL